VIFALITFAGIFAAIVLGIMTIVEIVHALETYRLKKIDPSHYRVRGGLSSDDAKWLARLDAFGQWLDRKKPESNQ
jgi:hypothetical protein